MWEYEKNRLAGMTAGQSGFSRQCDAGDFTASCAASRPVSTTCDARSGPFLRAMQDAGDFNDRFAHTIHGKIR